MNATSLLVDTENKLKCALNDFERAKIMCIDTEYDSFHYFRKKLCLIQIHAGKTTYVFDPLGDLALSGLGKYLTVNAYQDSTRRG